MSHGQIIATSHDSHEFFTPNMVVNWFRGFPRLFSGLEDPPQDFVKWVIGKPPKDRVVGPLPSMAFLWPKKWGLSTTCYSKWGPILQVSGEAVSPKGYTYFGSVVPIGWDF